MASAAHAAIVADDAHAANVEPSTLLQGHFSAVMSLSLFPDGWLLLSLLTLLIISFFINILFLCPFAGPLHRCYDPQPPSQWLAAAVAGRCQPCLRCSQCPPHLLHPFPAGPLQRCHLPQPLSRWLLPLTLLILAQILHLRPFAGSLQCCHVPQPLSRRLAAAVSWARQGCQCVGHSNQLKIGNGACLRSGGGRCCSPSRHGLSGCTR